MVTFLNREEMGRWLKDHGLLSHVLPAKGAVLFTQNFAIRRLSTDLFKVTPFGICHECAQPCEKHIDYHLTCMQFRHFLDGGGTAD